MRKLIRTDGSEQELPEPQTLAMVRALIGAETLDMVQLRHMGSPPHIMFVDDLGFRKDREVNAKATELYHANCRKNVDLTPIVGDVVVAPESDPE